MTLTGYDVMVYDKVS